MFNFFILEHFFQFLFLICLFISSIIYIWLYLLFTKYPEMVFDKLSTFNFFAKMINLNNNESINKSIELVDKSQEFYDSLMNKIFYKTIYPILTFFSINSFIGYGIGYFLKDSSIILNITLLIVSFFIVKKVFYSKIK